MKHKLPEQRLISYSQPAPNLSPSMVLRAAQGESRFAWLDGDSAWVGFGTAAELTEWGENLFGRIESDARRFFQNALITHPEVPPRLFGGFAFRRDFVPDNTWAAFAPAHFVLPHYQLTQRNGDSWLTINVLIGPDESPDSTLSEMQEALQARYEWLMEPRPAPALPHATHIHYPMSYDTWAEMIENAVRHIQADALEKVVLARACELRFSEPVEVESALAYLNQHYPECFRFLFEPQPHHAFYGATPELLVAVNGQEFHTMGLAGSIRRGASLEEDRILQDRILNDPKERHEHDLVVEMQREKLTPLTSYLVVPDIPEILSLKNIQHLHTPINGKLHEDSGVLRLADLLHPTPALGGVPREAALEFIAESEPIPRGWYAAPVGWFDANINGEFAVAIRSAIAQDRRVWLYAGAGIVGDSQPQKEWDETGLKFRPMLNALGVTEELYAR